MRLRGEITINSVKPVTKELGERIGYGHMMALATSLWRKSLKEQGYPVEGAFVTTCLPFMKEEDRVMVEREIKNYDKIIEES